MSRKFESCKRANVQTWSEQCCVEDVSQGAKMGAKLGGVVTRGAIQSCARVYRVLRSVSCEIALVLVYIRYVYHTHD